MKNKWIHIVLLVISVVLLYTCRKLYNPTIKTSGVINYLVVEGMISTNDSTVIKLSRTVPVAQVGSTNPELGAIVSILSDAGSSYQLVETGRGYYSAPNLNLGSSNKYGLKITTSDGKIYQSDLVQVRNSPPIDSVYYKVVSNGVKVYADTHDPTGNTRYYQWTYGDTYRFHSAFDSHEIHVKLNGEDAVVARNPSQFFFTCYRSDTSTSILINTSAKLAKDIISLNQILFIPSDAEQIEDRYSILVKQYALTADAFNYLQQLKKNTEQLGSIFDPQPSDLRGNITCISDPNVPVLGYISAGSSVSKRIYIDNINLPAWRAVTPYSTCLLDSALFCAGKGCTNQVAEEIYPDYQVPIVPIISPVDHITVIGYTASSQACVDCTLRGTITKPAFWIDE
jgi:uncharacterized protein DUF4249